MLHTSNTAGLPTETDDGVPGVSALNGEGRPIFNISLRLPPQGPTIRVDGYLYRMCGQTLTSRIYVKDLNEPQKKPAAHRRASGATTDRFIADDAGNVEDTQAPNDRIDYLQAIADEVPYKAIIPTTTVCEVADLVKLLNAHAYDRDLLTACQRYVAKAEYEQ